MDLDWGAAGILGEEGVVAICAPFVPPESTERKGSSCDAACQRAGDMTQAE
jgi:hypothetical protein